MARGKCTDIEQEQLGKVGTPIVELAKSKVPQRLIVELEATEILERAEQRQRVRGLPYQDEQIIREIAEDLDSLKSSVFPDGHLGAAKVVSHDRHVPIVVTLVPDWAALVGLLTHPKVKAIYEVKTYVPAGT